MEKQCQTMKINDTHGETRTRKEKLWKTKAMKNKEKQWKHMKVIKNITQTMESYVKQWKAWKTSKHNETQWTSRNILEKHWKSRTRNEMQRKNNANHIKTKKSND